MKPPLVIGVDVDDVCADLIGEWLRRYNLKFGDTLLPEDLTGWDLETQVKCGAEIFEFLYAKDLYDHVLPIQGARSAVNDLRTLGRVVFITACAPQTSDRKYRWLQRNGFLPDDKSAMQDFYPVKDKSLISADVLIDDGFHNIEKFPRKSILVRRPHNRNCTWPLTISSLAEAPAKVASLISAGEL